MLYLILFLIFKNLDKILAAMTPLMVPIIMLTGLTIMLNCIFAGVAGKALKAGKKGIGSLFNLVWEGIVWFFALAKPIFKKSRNGLKRHMNDFWSNILAFLLATLYIIVLI